MAAPIDSLNCGKNCCFLTHLGVFPCLSIFWSFNSLKLTMDFPTLILGKAVPLFMLIHLEPDNSFPRGQHLGILWVLARHSRNRNNTSRARTLTTCKQDILA